MEDYCDKYIRELKGHTETYKELTQAYKKYSSKTMFQIAMLNAETEHLIPKMFSLRVGKVVRRYMRAVLKAEAEERGRQKVIQHGMKVWG